MTSTPLYGVVSQTRGGHLLDRLVDVGYAAGVKDERAIGLHSYYYRVGERLEASRWAKLNYGRTLNLIGAAGGAACRQVKECVVRYGRERKQVTRRRIVEAAGRRFKADGINGSGIAALMADVGLTNGAFYAHFDSKDDLVVAAVADQLREQREDLGAAAPGPAGAEQFLRVPLDPASRQPRGRLPVRRPARRDRPQYGPDQAGVHRRRAGRHRRRRRRVAPDDPQSVRVQTLSIYALMVGTLQLSRALADQQLADVVLEQGIQSALTLLGAEGRR